MADLDRVRSNIGRMIDGGASETEIDAYLGHEGVTAEQLRAKPAPATPQHRQGLAGAFMDGVDAVADGMTFGVAPYIRGAVRGALDGDMSIGEAIDYERGDQARRREQRPIGTFINEMAGGGITGGGMANAGLTAARFVPKNGSVAQRAAAIGADGAAMGTVSAAAEGQNPGTGAMLGFATGAGASAGLDKLARYLGRSRTNRAPTRSMDEVKGAESQAWDEFRAHKAEARPDFYQRVVENAENRLMDTGFSPDLPSEQSTVRFLKRLQDRANRPPSQGVPLEELQDIRSQIGGRRRNTTDGTERHFLDQLRGAIDDARSSASPDDLMPRQDVNAAFSAWTRAIRRTKQTKKSEALDWAIERGERAASGEIKGVRNKVRSLLDNAKTAALFTDEEKALMEAYVKGGSGLEQNLNRVGKVGVKIGAGQNALGAGLGAIGGLVAGGPAGALAVPAIGTVAAEGADAMARHGLGRIQNVVNNADLPPQAAQLSGLARLFGDEFRRRIASDAITGGVTSSWEGSGGNTTIPKIVVRPLPQ